MEIQGLYKIQLWDELIEKKIQREKRFEIKMDEFRKKDEIINNTDYLHEEVLI